MIKQVNAESTRLVHITTVPVSLVALIGDQIAYMKAKGFDVHGIASPGEMGDKFVQTQQVPFHPVPMTREISPFKDIVSLFRLWVKLRQLKPKIVHSHTPKAGLLGILAAWLAGVDIRIYQVRGLRYVTASGFKRRVLMLTERTTCLFAKQVICNSQSNMQQMLTDGLCSPEKITVLLKGSGNGVDAETRFNPDRSPADIGQEVRSRYDIPPDALVIGSIGRIVRDKGMIEMAEAWQQLKANYANLHWLVVGTFEEEDPIPAEVRRLLETDDRIHLTGYVDNQRMPEIFSAIDILAFPSYREGFPISILEAAAMGVPTVAAAVTGCVDAVVDGVTGTLVPVKDADALAEALSTYIDDPQLRQKHGNAARERVLRDFRPEDIWQAIYMTYIELLKNHGDAAAHDIMV